MLVIDDFLDDPYEIRRIALREKFYNNVEYGQQKEHWAGFRTQNLHGPFFTELRNRLNTFFPFTLKFDIYFHYILEENNSSNEWTNRVHKDTDDYSGVIYLSENPKRESGTITFDDNFEPDILVENKFNRMVMYSGKIYHCPMSSFGNSIDTSRLTLTFFGSKIG